MVQEVETGLIAPLTRDGRAKFSPCFSPDGRYLVFTADYHDAFNLYALDLESSLDDIRVITDELTGVFDPAFSSGGSELTAVLYTAGGDQLITIPFDFNSLSSIQPHHAPTPDRPDFSEKQENGTVYYGLKYIAPQFWLPLPYFPDRNIVPAAFTMGADPLQIHQWWAWAGSAVQDQGQLVWDAGYAYNGAFPELYVNSAAYHPEYTFDVVTREPFSAQTESCRQRITEFSWGTRFNWTLASNVTYSRLGAEIGYHFRQRKNLSAGSLIVLPKGREAGIDAVVYWLRGYQNRRDLTFVGELVRFDIQQDTGWLGSDFEQHEWGLLGLKNWRSPLRHADIVQLSASLRRWQSPLLWDDDIIGETATPAQPRSWQNLTIASTWLNYLLPIKEIDRGYGDWPIFIDRLTGRLTAGLISRNYGANQKDSEDVYIGALAGLRSTVFYALPWRIETGWLFNLGDGSTSFVWQFNLNIPAAQEGFDVSSWRTDLMYHEVEVR